MRIIQPPTLFTFLSTLLTCTHALPAGPDAASSENDSLQQLLETRYHYLSARSCANPCGWSGQVCCGTGQTCTTNSAGQAACAGSSSGSGAQVAAEEQNGQWEFYTTTYVETDLVTMTSTYSSYFGSETSAAPAAISGISCDSGLGESPCGTLCCATGQYCAYAGQCAASNGAAGESSSVYIFESTATAAASAPVRPTSNAAITVTSTGSATTTVPFETPTAGPASASASALPGMTSTTSNNGLSAGAIAGIVIGVLAGLFFLFIICAILCCKGLIDGILDFFGLRSRKRKETYIEEEHRHSGRTWYGAKRPTTVVEKKKTSGVGGLTGVAGALGLLAIFLGLKRRSDRRKSEKAESRYTESTYDDYYSDTSPSRFGIFRRSQKSKDEKYKSDEDDIKTGIVMLRQIAGYQAK